MQLFDHFYLLTSVIEQNGVRLGMLLFSDNFLGVIFISQTILYDKFFYTFHGPYLNGIVCFLLLEKQSRFALAFLG